MLPDRFSGVQQEIGKDLLNLITVKQNFWQRTQAGGHLDAMRPGQGFKGNANKLVEVAFGRTDGQILSHMAQAADKPIDVRDRIRDVAQSILKKGVRIMI